MDKLISVVVPMYFEEAVVNECYRRLSGVLQENRLNYELIFVDDGSKDNTLPLLEEVKARDERVNIISFSRNFGHQIAVTAGVDQANGDAIIIIDADLQDPPELIPRMVELWEKGYEVVYAQRKRRKGEKWFKLFTAKLFYRMLNKFTDIEIPIDTGDFRLIDRKIAEKLKQMPERNRFIRGMVSWLGFKQIALEYEREERFAGETKYSLKKMIKLAKDGIISFSAKPIEIIEKLSGISVIFSMIIGVWGLAVSSTSLMLVSIMLFLNGIQLAFMGVLGEYIVRIYDESKKRPLYVVKKKAISGR